MSNLPLIAYFSMEIAVDPAMPTYAGGLGILAGDTLRSCANLSVPIGAVTLLHRRAILPRVSLRRAGSENRRTTG